MVTERYAHILDDNRRINAERFQQQFYSSPASEEPAAQPDPLQQLDAGEKQALLLKLLTESPEMATILKSLTQAMKKEEHFSNKRRNNMRSIPKAIPG